MRKLKRMIMKAAMKDIGYNRINRRVKNAWHNGETRKKLLNYFEEAY